MLDFTDYLMLSVFFIIFNVIIMVIMRYQFDQAILLIDKKIGDKMKTFRGTLTRMKGSEREPSNLETIASLAQTFMAMKAEGYSIKDILSEFGMSAVEETVKAATGQTEDP